MMVEGSDKSRETRVVVVVVILVALTMRPATITQDSRHDLVGDHPHTRVKAREDEDEMRERLAKTKYGMEG